MQYGVIPESLAERVALLTGAVPVPLIDTLFGMMKARMVMAGVRLGIFEALAREAHGADGLAAALRLDAASLELLLRALVFCGYLETVGERFALSPLARQTMTSGAPKALTGFVQWNYTQWEWAGELERLVRTGQGVDFHSTLDDREAWRHYQTAMFETARFDAPTLARHVPVRKGATRLLDLAGSHGLIGATLCRKHPPMRSTVLDLPSAIEHARDLARAAGHADLVDYRAGDLLQDDFGEGWDVIVLSNILHHFAEAVVQRIIGRAAAALAAGGTIAIWDLERPAKGSRPAAGDAVALFFRLTSSASAYSGPVRRLAQAAGCTQVKTVRPRLRPGNVLVTGRKVE